MSQIFRPGATTIARAALLGVAMAVVLVLVVGFFLVRSMYATGVAEVVDQPVPFSHQHHVSGLGIDCRYCHTSVETSFYANIPSTHTCMSCHSQIWTQAPVLAPVRDSYASDQPIQWNKVHDLGDFVYFNHSIHVQKGVGCATCHGPVDQMPLTWKDQPMTMEWCLNCHRAPEQFLRPREQVFNMDYQQPADQLALGERLVQEYHIDTSRLTNCAVCHR